MVNPRLIEIAERLGSTELPREKAIQEEAKPAIMPKANNSFILEYDGFGKELIAKSNKLFAGTKAEIPLEDSGEVPNMYILKRAALITAIHKDKQLASYNAWPITPLQSEQLLKAGNLPKPDEYWEDLALILYSKKGSNNKEAAALYKSISDHASIFGLSKKNLESRFLIINPGIEKDASMPHGVKPIILPGLTDVYMHPILDSTKDFPFDYGLEHGLPSVSSVGKGSRTFYIPGEKKPGLRVLYRGWVLDLYAWGDDLTDSDPDARVNFAR